MKRLLLICIVPILLLISCKTNTKLIEVPVETIKTEYIHDVRIDSVHIKDSVDRWLSGDTLYIYKEKNIYKYKFRTDTLIKTDTIPKLIKVETTKEVKVNYIKWYQKWLMYIGGIGLLVIITLVVYKLKQILWK